MLERAYTPMNDTLEQDISALGKAIFSDLSGYNNSPLERGYWNTLFTRLTINLPELRTSLFRLVDVLPALDSDDIILRHLLEYLYKPLAEYHPALGCLLRLGEARPLRRITATLVRRSVAEMAKVFIAGETPLEAIPQLNRLLAHGQSFTVDLLGEYSLSEQEAILYLERYLEVVDTLDKHLSPVSNSNRTHKSSVCISIKLSALYSQIDSLNFESSVNILSDRLSRIARAVEQVSGTLYVDAEDSKYNPIVYETFKRVFGSEEFKLIPHPGIVVQAYSRDALDITNDLLQFAADRGAPIAVRLVKGAYWDSEQVIASQNNWSCPLFSVKEHSDANFEDISKLLLDNTSLCRPAFASHNIRSLTHACCYAERNGLGKDTFEIQVLYGMADAIANTFTHRGYQTRFYAPIGKLIPGMGYLVRRLLENSSNESFIRHTFFEPTAIEKLLAKPAPIRSQQLIHDINTKPEFELTLSFHY